MDGDGCPCGCGRSTSAADLAGHEDEFPTACVPGEVAVRVLNSYTCGRRSGWVQILDAPPRDLPDDALDDWFHEHVVMGNGHGCGSREHARYEVVVVVVAAPGRPELLGRAGGGEG